MTVNKWHVFSSSWCYRSTKLLDFADQISIYVCTITKAYTSSKSHSNYSVHSIGIDAPSRNKYHTILFSQHTTIIQTVPDGTPSTDWFHRCEAFAAPRKLTRWQVRREVVDRWIWSWQWRCTIRSGRRSVSSPPLVRFPLSMAQLCSQYVHSCTHSCTTQHHTETVVYSASARFNHVECHADQIISKVLAMHLPHHKPSDAVSPELREYI